MKKSLEKRIECYKHCLYDEFKGFALRGEIASTYSYELARQYKFYKHTDTDVPKAAYEAVKRHYERVVDATSRD